MSMEDYVTNNKAAMCNCPRQCRHLAYNHDFSQALISNHVVKFIKSLAGATNVTIDDIRNEMCMLEVVRYVCLQLWTHLLQYTTVIMSRECCCQRRRPVVNFVGWGDQGF